MVQVLRDEMVSTGAKEMDINLIAERLSSLMPDYQVCVLSVCVCVSVCVCLFSISLSLSLFDADRSECSERSALAHKKIHEFSEFY